ncbi:helix-turn-helix transcriptional regulator [Geoalkalibacter sp.]|uniref:helix-turn-helix transcriptional regulator n=1 Tax=Geoalkalibacter sp. TaxID=3041440 RepID=UPI00272EDBA8|nr:helix-turn-helix transcriptional regulator [Geoalkalibacter sp.]
MKPILPPMVNLDSEAIRRIREEKKLTQLYVAKVVGVTTDTVSRWENNRYPSIKRENALRLAEALEVSVEEILEKTASEATPAPASSEPPATAEVNSSTSRSFSWIWILPAVALLAAGLVYFLVGRQEELLPDKFSAQRLLPNHAAPGSVIPVRIRLTVDTTSKGFILREHFPKGWQLIEANPPPSSLDNEDGVARWMIKPGEESPRVVYRLRVDPQAHLGSLAEFGGEIVVSPKDGPKGRSAQVPTGGSGRLKVAQILWADLNGDGVIDDAEMLEASDTLDEMKGVHMDWNMLEEIWDAGGYRWFADKNTFVPEKPAPRTLPPPAAPN